MRTACLALSIVSLAFAAQAEDAVTEIRLERTPCFGSCPVDEVILRPDGTATYIGKRFVERAGRYEGTFNRGVFERLAKLLEAQKFFDMEDRYDVPETDNPSVITSATRGGAEKRVVDYGNGGPIELWGIEEAIRGVVAEVEWRKAE